jgi:hypothetical protein
LLNKIVFASIVQNYNWENAKMTMPTMWCDFYIAPPWLMIEPIGAIPGNGVMVLPTTIPATPPAPYDVYLQGLVGVGSEGLTNLFVLEVR